jgi:hypothetical protein
VGHLVHCSGCIGEREHPKAGVLVACATDDGFIVFVRYGLLWWWLGVKSVIAKLSNGEESIVAQLRKEVGLPKSNWK